MSIQKIASTTLFSMEALLGWTSSGYLYMMSFLASTELIGNITEVAAVVFGLGTGFFTTMRFIETYRLEKIKRRQEEIKLKRLEHEYSEDEVTGV